MIKFIVKTVIVLLALQSAMDYLRQEEIIEGSIRVNYPVIRQKLIAALPPKKIAAGLVQRAAGTVKKTAAAPVYAAENGWSEAERADALPSFRIVYHVVTAGESLADLAQRYQIHWRVIQKANHISAGEPLYVGQVLKIPSRIKNMDHFDI